MNDEILLMEGWHRQTTIDEPRLSEIADNYRLLGYETRVVRDGVVAGCGHCDLGGGVGTLYIRQGFERPSADDDELFLA